MKRSLPWWAIALLVLLVGAWAWHFRPHQESPAHVVTEAERRAAYEALVDGYKRGIIKEPPSSFKVWPVGRAHP